MIPPIDSQILEENPEFAKLYATLKSDILNPDGSTKTSAEAKRRQGVRHKLDQIRIGLAKNSLIEQAVCTVSPPPIDRDMGAKTAQRESLVDILLLLPSLVGERNYISAENASTILSGPPFSELETLLPDVAALVSANLHASALSLARIVHPSISSSQLHHQIPSLPNNILGLRAEVDEADQALVAKRLESLEILASLLDEYTQSLTLLIQTMEQKHGPVAENLELKAADVSLLAQQAERDSNATLNSLQKEMYPPEAITALQNYLMHLKDAKVRTKERVRGLKAELTEYDVAVKGGDG